MAYLYHHIHVTLPSTSSPPYFTGSMLRGAFGHALKHTICINPTSQCDGCFAEKSCLYYHFYEQKNLQHSYRFDVSMGSDRYDFGLYLFGEATQKLGHVLNSLEMALGTFGLGNEPKRKTFNTMEVSVNGMPVHRDQSFADATGIEPQQFVLSPAVADVKIHFLTPLRIKKGNELEFKKIKIEHILRSIYQRSSQIFEERSVHALDYTPTYLTSVKALEYKPLYRRSERQGQKITMDGVLGEMAVLGLDKRSHGLLKLGELLGVGKQTVFGLGKIKIEELDRK